MIPIARGEHAATAPDGIGPKLCLSVACNVSPLAFKLAARAQPLDTRPIVPKAKRCEHPKPTMIAYCASPGQAHASAHWCPACGALGWTHYERASVTTWHQPGGTAAAAPRVRRLAG